MTAAAPPGESLGLWGDSEERPPGDNTTATAPFAVSVNDVVLAAAVERDLTLLDVRTLLLLDVRGPVPLGDVGRHLGVAASSVTLIADRLAGCGLAQRQPHAADRRVLLLGLMPAGHGLLRTAPGTGG